MSIPVREIPQATQDELRGMVDAAVWGRLSEAVRDRILRAMNGLRFVHFHLDEFVTLFNPSIVGDPSRFADLTEREQNDVLDIATLRPGLGDMLRLRDVVDYIGAHNPDGAVRDAMMTYVTWPARPPSIAVVAARLRLQRWRAEQHGLRLTALGDVLRTPAFAQRSAEEQRKIIEVLHRTRPFGALLFHDLLRPATTRWAPGTVASGTLPLFSESLLERITLLEALHRLATATLHADISVAPLPADAFLREPFYPPALAQEADLMRVVGNVVAEVARPDQYFNQSNRGTCFSTSLLHRLGRVRPAEYARIAHELITTTRAQLQNGEPVTVPPDARPADNSTRSVSERVTQAMLSEYWIAGELRDRYRGPHYHNTSPQAHADHTNPTGEATDHWDGSFSTWPARLARTAEALLGQRFNRVRGHPIATLRAHFAAHPDVPIFAGVTWGDDGHEVDVLSVDAPDVPHGRVHYWNPWGALLLITIQGCPIRVESGTVETQGRDIAASREGPARRTDDDSRALQSMTIQQFSRIFVDLLVPAQ